MKLELNLPKVWQCGRLHQSLDITLQILKVSILDSEKLKKIKLLIIQNVEIFQQK